MDASLAIQLEQQFSVMLMLTVLVFTKLMMLSIKDKALSVHELTILVKKGRI